MNILTIPKENYGLRSFNYPEVLEEKVEQCADVIDSIILHDSGKPKLGNSNRYKFTSVCNDILRGNINSSYHYIIPAHEDNIYQMLHPVYKSHSCGSNAQLFNSKGVDNRSVNILMIGPPYTSYTINNTAILCVELMEIFSKINYNHILGYKHVQKSLSPHGFPWNEFFEKVFDYKKDPEINLDNFVWEEEVKK